MSTVLVNTNGLSKFQDGTELANFGQGQDSSLRQLGLSLTDTDNKPILVPNRQVIDVVNDFSWYAGPKSTAAALNKVPCIFLTEREQLLSSLISGGLYYLNAGSRAVNTVAQSGFVNSLLGKAQEGGNVEKLVNGFQNGAKSAFEGLNNLAGGTASDRLLLNQNNLKSLEGIYFTKPTGFNYRLPMYDAPSNPTSDGYGEGNTSGLLGDVIGMGQKIVENISKAVNFAQPGTYIEQPQYFKGAGVRTTEL